MREHIGLFCGGYTLYGNIGLFSAMKDLHRHREYRVVLCGNMGLFCGEYTFVQEYRVVL